MIKSSASGQQIHQHLRGLLKGDQKAQIGGPTYRLRYIRRVRPAFINTVAYIYRCKTSEEKGG